MRRAWFLFYLSPALVAVLGVALVAWIRDRDRVRPAEHAVGVDTFREALDLIEADYVEDVSREDLIAAAVKGMTDVLDRHSRGYDERELAAFRTSSRGDEVGIGIHFGRVDDRWWVFRVVPQSPAARGGLRDGDEILAIGDAPVTAASEIEELRRRIVGPEGERIAFRVRGWKSDETRDVRVRRGAYHNEKVYAELLRDHVGYLRLEGFDESTPRRAKKELDRLRTAGARAWVLDLRGNPGGSLPAAVEIVGLFAELPVVLSSVSRREREVYGSEGPAAFPEDPLALLVDGGSASASEIVAGALQDVERAFVFGERSYGKGLVQNVFELRTRPLGLKFTVARWFTPAGRLIQRGGRGEEDVRGGIRPDHAVPVSEAERRAIALDWSRQRILPDILEFMESDPAFESLPAGYADRPLEAALDWLDGRPPARPIEES
ncbi:MAG: S41 family peptidase [Planctomycetota bacterium]